MHSFHKCGFGCFFSVVVSIGLFAPAVLAEECSIAKTNKTCTLTLDRQNPLAPPAIQMYPHQTLTVEVRNPYYFERYFLDYSSGQLALSPDIASNIASAVLPSFKNFSQFHDSLFELRLDNLAAPPGAGDLCSIDNVSFKAPPKKGDITLDRNTLFLYCLNAFDTRARQIYRQLEAVVAPDAHPQGPATTPLDQSALSDLATNTILPLYSKQAALSYAIASAAKLLDATGDDALISLQQDQVRNWMALSALADAVNKDLSGFASRIDDLSKNPVGGATACADGVGTCVSLAPRLDPPVDNAKMATRQVTYAVDALNLIQNAQEGIPDPTKKKTIASVTIVYGDSRWETSAGTFFSTLANRSFAISPVLANGTVIHKQVTENVLHPTVVPFAAVNVRLSRDLPRVPWRSAFYWTFAVGINPDTVSTDFGTGPSISWRGLMISALWHVGHDVRLTQGLYKDQILDPGYSGGSPSQNYWRLDRVALGISVRIPALSGR